MTQKSTENLSADIFRTLKERIVCWKYAPGHRIIETELCEEFGVSRTPIREALGMLVENGLVDKQSYKGYSVKQPNLEEMAEIYDVRLPLELYVVEWLTKNGMRSDVWENLCTIWQEMSNTLLEDITDVTTKDEEFHETLALCTDNQMLIQYLKNLAERLHWIRMTDITSSARFQLTCEQHIEILECIKAGNVECARKAVQMNIEGGRNNIEQAVKEALVASYLGS